MRMILSAPAAAPPFPRLARSPEETQRPGRPDAAGVVPGAPVVAPEVVGAAVLAGAVDEVAAEVEAVRTAVGAYETGVYSRYEVSGPGARAWLDHVLAGSGFRHFKKMVVGEGFEPTTPSV